MLFSACTKQAAAPKLETDEQKTIYALGLSVGKSLAPINLSPSDLEILKQAIADNIANKPAVDIDVYGPKIADLAKARQAKQAEGEKVKAKAYEAKMAGEAGAQKSSTGLIYKEVTAGSGAMPKDTDVVSVNYKGTLTDGTEFDSSYKNKAPLDIPLNRVIPCWTEGVQKMKVGGKSLLVCPAELAYGDNAQPGIPAGSTLTFEVELLAIKPPLPEGVPGGVGK